MNSEKCAVPQVEFILLVFTCMPGDSYRRRLRSLLSCLCDVFRALINHCVLILWRKQNKTKERKKELPNYQQNRLVVTANAVSKNSLPSHHPSTALFCLPVSRGTGLASFLLLPVSIESCVVPVAVSRRNREEEKEEKEKKGRRQKVKK